jgi:hypothetical protein
MTIPGQRLRQRRRLDLNSILLFRQWSKSQNPLDRAGEVSHIAPIYRSLVWINHAPDYET